MINGGHSPIYIPRPFFYLESLKFSVMPDPDPASRNSIEVISFWIPASAFAGMTPKEIANNEFNEL